MELYEEDYSTKLSTLLSILDLLHLKGKNCLLNAAILMTNKYEVL
jgi:hypothetical protein